MGRGTIVTLACPAPASCVCFLVRWCEINIIPSPLPVLVGLSQSQQSQSGGSSLPGWCHDWCPKSLAQRPGNEITQWFLRRGDGITWQCGRWRGWVTEDWAESTKSRKVVCLPRGEGREGKTASANAGAKSICFMECFMVQQ